MSQCPWQGFAPQIDARPFCEERLCAWIVEPANTWTNIGYLIVAILIYKSRNSSPEAIKLFSRASFFLFLGSTLFHATGTVFGKMADVAAMFALSMGILSLAVKRLFLLNDRRTEIFYLIGMIISLAFLFIFKFGNVLFAGQVFAIIAIEIFLQIKGRTELDLKKFAGAIATLLVAFAFWNLDVSRMACDPQNHFINGHGVWHLLAAVAIYLMFRSYRTPA